MASSPVTAPSPETSSNPPPPSNDSSPPPPPQSPPPKDESPPPAASPPPKAASPPAPSNESSPPPPLPPPPPPPTPPPPESSNNNNPSPNPPPPPPPPPPHSKSPPGALSPPRAPPHKGSHKSSDSDTSASDGSMSDKVPVIVGVTAGIVVLLIALIAIIVCFAKKKKRRHEPIPSYMDPRHKGGDQLYGSHSQHGNWHNGGPNPTDPMHKVPPPPGAAGPPVGGVWLQPPPMMISSEMSSGFSGPRPPVLPPPSPNIALGFNKSTFSYDELAAATSRFSQANLLGQGGFGFVHKGVLPNGKVIAVKSLKLGSGQGEREFQAEVEIISRVHHRHLVSLVGYCIAGEQRMLVYEFVPNNTLEYHLHGSGRPIMEWSKRLTIALGSAKGLAYLHEDCHPRIIHRDIKAANILLDDKFEAMVADFGLAKLSSDNYTHVSTRVMGTFGYLAPEYASSGKLTEKSDVFSYGVMLLELITGRRPVDTTNAYMEDSLVDWARPLLTRSLGDGNYNGLVDPMLEGNFDPSEMARMVACAAASIRHSAKRRPKMSQIVRALEGDVSLDDLNEGARLGNSSKFTSSSDYDTGEYNSDMKKFRKMALETQEYDSSEYSGQTGESGVNEAYTTTSSDAANSREMNQFGNHRLSP